MEFIKKQSIGFYTTVLSCIAMIVGIAYYLCNCKTKYFSNLGINKTVVVCGVIAIIGLVAYMILNEMDRSSLISNFLPIVCGVLMMIAVVAFIGSRVYGIASIITFENNAENMADLTNAFTGMIWCVAAVVLQMISSFFNIKKAEV